MATLNKTLNSIMINSTEWKTSHSKTNEMNKKNLSMIWNSNKNKKNSLTMIRKDNEQKQGIQ